MSLIGILTENNNKNYLKQQLKSVINEEQLLFFNENCIENLKNITFETVLIGKEIKKHQNELRMIAQKADNLIFNTDITNNLNLLDDLNLKLITYGFNSKATITTSSVDENRIMVCLQRNVQNIKGKIVEAQEIEINTNGSINSYAVMELIGLKLLYFIK